MVIVGAGECGVRAALALRESGYVGAVTLLGAERHPPYERPPLSKALMFGAPGVPPKTIATAERLAEADIAFLSSTSATAIDRVRQQVSTSEGTIGYDRLLLATGASPRRLPMNGANGTRFAYLRTYDDAIWLRGRLVRDLRVVIVGGGFIGLEFAAAARLHGARVTVLEALPRLLSRAVPADLAAILDARHRIEGVDIRLGASLTAIEDGIRNTTLHLADGSCIDADLVLVGIGAVPETALAISAGLAIDNGIAVDLHLATSDPMILAAGDCCSFPLPQYGGRRVRLESWRNAQQQGELAARNMLGANEAISAVPWFWTDQYDLTLQIAGLPDEAAETVRREVDGSLVLFHLAPDGRLAAASGIGIGNAVARDIRVAEMLIAMGARPNPASLANPGLKLKSLLAA